MSAAPDPNPRAPRRVARRALLRAAAVPLALPLAPVAAQPAGGALAPTPRQSRGPFYPPDPPKDAGPDLVMERDGRRAAGDLVRLDGRVIDTAGRPLAGTLVELWQCNAAGRYHHPNDSSAAPIDPLFAGYGRAIATADGRWRFRTIRPVPYPGRTPHIHLQFTAPGGRTLVTQLYVRDEPANARDGLLARLSAAERERLTAPFERMADGTYQAAFEAVLPA
jgi:protocatechuate 3,4-dioxygenase beta subunit